MKKKISMLLSLVMAISSVACLSGCGGSAEDKNTLVWYTIGDEPKANAEVLAEANKIIEPAIGKKLKIKYIPVASYAEQMKLKMASGEAYDLCFTGYVNPYQTAVEMGGLYDITDLITETGLDQVVEPYFLDSARVNGKVYGVPNTQVISNPNCFMIAKHIAEEAGVVEDFKKYEEYATNDDTSMEDVKRKYAVIDKILEKVKSKFPDLYTIGESNRGIEGYKLLMSGIYFKKEADGSIKLYKNIDLEGYKYGVEKLREWYKKGYIRQDIASAPPATTTEEKKKQAISETTWKPGQDVFYISEYGYEPLYTLNDKPFVSRTSALATMVSVGANTRYPKEAVQLIKMMNENVELYNLICWGIEGKHYKKNEDGTATVIKGSGYDDVAQNAWKYGNQFNGFVMEGQPADVYEQTKKMNDEAVKSDLLGFVPDTSKIATEIANVANVEAEFKAKRDMGTDDVDTWWDTYCKKLKDAGQDKILAEMQKQIDAFVASKAE